jgi:hypothetical protein
MGNRDGRTSNGIRECRSDIHPIGGYNSFTMSSTTILDRFLEPVVDKFTPDFARALVDLRAEPEWEAKAAEWRRKANSGTLTPEEESEYRDFVEAVDVIAILQSKARRFLSKNPA